MSKKDRRKVLARIWGTPTSRDIDFIDEGNEIVVASSSKGIVAWWLQIFQAVYPNIKYLEKGDVIKLKPTVDVSVKLNKTTRLMRITGKGHWRWFVDNFEQLLDEGNNEAETLSTADSSENSVTRYLQLDKDDALVQDLLDQIPEGGGIMQNDYIMRLWKSLLDDWFGVGAIVYVVTPRIDSERLFQMMLLMLRNKGTGFGVTLVTPTKTTDGEKFAKVMDMTKRRLKEVKVLAPSGHQKRLVSDVKVQWALDSLTIVHEDFSTNFIAAYKDDEAEVLTTTAHFHKSHFHFNLKDNVCYNRLPTNDLKRNYLLPLNVTSNIF
ncbi:uncharacterized protein [Littorina saxatilis]|uniref:Uncharacterized protein n=1 Tax=Littorina saxatilis TaxID=31220 RepID=A0AAN9GAY5_9CAEN